MDDDALRQLYRVRSAIRELVEWIATHDITEWRITVEEVVEDTRLTRRQVIGALRELAELGCGQFKVGRKGHASRFEWRVDPSVVVARMIEQDDGPHEVPTNAHDDELIESREPQTVDAGIERSNGEQLDESSRSAMSAQYMIGHAYVLRPDLRVEVELPADLTPREAEVLSAWLRDLSFER